jgi:hypothetical protein
MKSSFIREYIQLKIEMLPQFATAPRIDQQLACSGFLNPPPRGVEPLDLGKRVLARLAMMVALLLYALTQGI